MDRIIIGDVSPTISEVFRAKLRTFDADLYVSWNPRRRRFQIEQCVGHHAPTAAHSHLCERIYVLLVQGDEGEMLGLGEHVFKELRARDVRNAGYTEDHRGAENFLRDMNNQCEASQRKIEADQADAVRHCSRMNRRQLLRAIGMMQQHSLEINR